MEYAAVLVLLALAAVLASSAGPMLQRLGHDLQRAAPAPHWQPAYDERGRLLDEDLVADPSGGHASGAGAPPAAARAAERG